MYNVDNAMKFGVMNKSTILNKFLLHTLQRNITHLAVITRKRNIKLGILKGGGGNWKRAKLASVVGGGAEKQKKSLFLHTLQRNSTRLPIITRKTTIKIESKFAR